MDWRHDHSRLLASSAAQHAFTMESPTAPHPHSAQLRTPYGDLGRPAAGVTPIAAAAAGSTGDTTSLSAYHSRYLAASLPLGSGSNFPFLGSMFTSSIPVPPTSPYRAPSTGVNNMRFWPPTPPPDGYGRYGMNTSLYPLFGSVAPTTDNGTFIAQGMVSRLGPTPNHFSHLIDSHKESAFFSSGIGLSSPLTPTSHVPVTAPYAALLPTLERHTSYGHMTLSGKDVDDGQHCLGAEVEELRLIKGHTDCVLKQDASNRHSSSERAKVKGESQVKHSEKPGIDSHKTSLNVSKEKSDDAKASKKVEEKSQDSKVAVCKVEVNSSVAIKQSISSPPLSDSSTKNTCTTTTTTISTPISSWDSKSSDSRCFNCTTNAKGIGVATKLSTMPQKCLSTTDVSSSCKTYQSVKDTIVTKVCEGHTVTVSTMSTTVAKTLPATTTVTYSHSLIETPGNDSKICHHSSSGLSSAHFSSSDVSSINTLSCHASNKPIQSCTTAPTLSSATYVHGKPPVSHSAKQVSKKDSKVELNSRLTADISLSPNITEGNKISIKPKCYVGSSNLYADTKQSSLQTSGPSVPPSSHNPTNTGICSQNSQKDATKTMKSVPAVNDMKEAKPNVTKSISPNISIHHLNGSDPAKRSLDETQSKINHQWLPCSAHHSDSSQANVQRISCCKSKTESASKNKNQSSNEKNCSAEKVPLKMETNINRHDCEFLNTSSTPPENGWSQARISPFMWQKNECNEDIQAINLTVSRKVPKIEPSETPPCSQGSLEVSNNTPPQTTALPTTTTVTITTTVSKSLTTSSISIKVPEKPTPVSGTIGVCHPNTVCSDYQKTVASNMSKVHISKPSNVPLSRTLEMPTNEKCLTQRSHKNPILGVAPNSSSSYAKSNISHEPSSLLAKPLKPERSNLRRHKLGDTVKGSHGNRNVTTSSLTSLAVNLSKTIVLPKEGQPTQCAVSSSTSTVVIPGTVNPCIPVGIAIAQQRQDTSTALFGKTQATHTSGTVETSNLTPATHIPITALPENTVNQQENERDHKAQEGGFSSSSDSSTLLVTQSATSTSRQWECETVSRAALPSSWVAHGPLVTPAVWLSQGAYASPAASSTTVPTVPVGPIDPPPITLPPGGYQLARDSITGHLFLIPAANIEIVDRSPSVWPSFTSAPSTLSLQQIVTQQPQTQFDQQILPQNETVKIADATESCTLPCETSEISTSFKSLESKSQILEGKIEETVQSSGVGGLPLTSGQTFAYTTFPAHCDPSSFSYILESSTVVHLAHSQTTAIQTESGKRSQGTSPLHAVTPSPPPQIATEQSIQVSTSDENLDEGEEDSDNESDGVSCQESTLVKLSNQTQSVTTAIQVDMDSQTNSEDDEEEHKVEMSDSANQTEIILTDASKEEETVEDKSESFVPDLKMEENDVPKPEFEISENEASVQTVQSPDVQPAVADSIEPESELAPILPVESQPVMDFIDHHGLNLLVDSIEEFASREQESLLKQEAEKSTEEFYGADIANPISSPDNQTDGSENEFTQDYDENGETSKSEYNTIDAPCTDGLGLLCALAEQRFLEENLSSHDLEDKGTYAFLETKEDIYDCYTFDDNVDNVENLESSYRSPAKDDNSLLKIPVTSLSKASSPSHMFGSPYHLGSSPQSMDAAELEMRLRLAELQRKYKEKQRELARLQPKKEKEELEKIQMKKGPGRPRKRRIFTLPRVKHPKTVMALKAASSLPSHSFRPMVSGMLPKKSVISDSLKKKQSKLGNKSNISRKLDIKKRDFKTIKKKKDIIQPKVTCIYKVPSSSENKKPADNNKQWDLSKNSAVTSNSSSVPQFSYSSTTILKIPKPKEHDRHFTTSSKTSTSKRLKEVNQKPVSLKSTACAANANITVPQYQPCHSSVSSSQLSASQSNPNRVPTFKVTKDGVKKTSEHKKPSVQPSSNISNDDISSYSTKASNTFDNYSVKSESVKTSSEILENSHVTLVKAPVEAISVANEKASIDESPPAKKIKLESMKSPSSTDSVCKESEMKLEMDDKSKILSESNEDKDESKPKVPFFDEQAWFRRRSERIFLSDATVKQAAGSPSTLPGNQNQNNGKKQTSTSTVSSSPVKNENHSKVAKTQKTVDGATKSQKKIKLSKDKETHQKKFKCHILSKHKSFDHLNTNKRSYSESSLETSSSSSDSESSESSSSQSEDVPLIVLMEQAASKGSSSISTKIANASDSDSSDSSSRQSEDIPLSMLIEQPPTKELRSCILTREDLQDKTRVLIMDGGLFYAGYLKAIQPPDVYGINLDGERAHRPHIFSQEEMLNAAVLEVKPTSVHQLPESTRICAFWSQQYRCLYPGTVKKVTSSLSGNSLVHVEFDDGDRGKISLEDIRTLPQDYPIVSMEPNSLMILGKRRTRIAAEQNSEHKSTSESSRNDKEKATIRKKSPSKPTKKNLDHSEHQESSKLPIKTTVLTNSANSGSSSSNQNSVSCVGKLTVKNSLSENKPLSKKREGSSEKKKIKKNKSELKVKCKEKLKGKSDANSLSNLSDLSSRPKKRKKHKDEHKKHHHHRRHHHHHHKKRKHDKLNSKKESTSASAIKPSVSVMPVNPINNSTPLVHSSDKPSPSLPSSSPSHEHQNSILQCHIQNNKHQISPGSSPSSETSRKSELTVTIKTSGADRSHVSKDDDEESLLEEEVELSSNSSSESSDSNDSSDEECSDSADKTKKASSKKVKSSNSGEKSNSGQKKAAAKRKDRLPSVETSKIAAFLPVRQLWRWSGKSFRRPGAKGKAKKEYYKAITRGKETIKVGDCAVFLSTGRPHLPYIGRIETMWQSWGGKMVVKVKWFYHPEETKGGKKLVQMKGALFQSPHFDENDVQTISHKCEVLSWEEYQNQRDQDNNTHSSSYGSIFDNNDIYYLAGTYDPITGALDMEPGIP